MARPLCTAVVTLAVLGAGCQRSAGAANGKMQVQDAVAQVVASGSGAVYLQITNATGADDRLVSAQTPLARQARLHQMVEDGEVLRMQEAANGFDLDAGETLRLQRGGKHLMLYGADPGASQLPLTLHFARAGPVTIEVPVKRGFDDEPK